jgi:hypothetical protein
MRCDCRTPLEAVTMPVAETAAKFKAQTIRDPLL